MRREYRKRRSNEELKLLRQQESPMCPCGCGELVKWSKGHRKWNKYVNGHNSRDVETRRKISMSHKGMKYSAEYRRNLSGPNNSQWQGGVSFELYPLEFNNQLKESIRERDNNTCQLCGKIEELKNRKLHIHHIDYGKNNCNPENLISLCNSCNSEVNFDREVWTKVFQNVIKRIYGKRVV